MKRLIMKLFGIDELIKQQKETNYWLEKIYESSENAVSLKKASNMAYFIQ